MYKSDIDWCPCLNLGHDKVNITSLEAASERATRTKQRRKRMEELSAGASGPSEIDTSETVTSLNICNFSSMETQTDSVLHDDKNVQTNIVELCTREVQTDCSEFFAESNFLSDDAKVHYYTGLPNSELLLSTFEFVMKSFVDGDNRSFYWRSFIIVLIKLRLNLGFQDLAFRLGVSKATISRRFHEALDIMATRLEWLIKWPDREELWKTMPNCFRPCYGVKVVAIVDCYEIKIETPSNLIAKSSTWSQYKHANTAKVFIAMCPQGLTTFISKTWGGRVSDKHLTLNSGFLNKLLPGDIILADRGFDIGEDVARMQAR